MFNTVILKKGKATLTKSEYEKFKKGDTIFGENSNPEEVGRWEIENEESAKEELLKHTCDFIKRAECWDVIEYALEYCECDEEGEFIEGSDYTFAKEDGLDVG